MKWQIFWIILSVLCIAYGLLVAAVQSGSRFFIVWLFGGVFFLLCAYLSKIHFWQNLPTSIKGIIIALVCLFAVLFIAIEGMIVKGFGEKGADNADYVIVLGAQVRTSGPSVVLKYRLDAAADYLFENENCKCIVSGGQGYNEPCPEAFIMRDYLIDRGIDESRILTEPESKNTKENMEFSKKLIDAKKDDVVIVSNNFHIFRAKALAKKAGIANISAIPAKSNTLYLPNNMFREFLGVIKDFLFGNI